MDANATASLHQRFGAQYPRGTIVVRQGDSDGRLYVLVKGEAELSVHGGDGPAIVVRRIGSGELFGVTSCFTGLPHTASLRLITDALLLQFDQQTVEHLIRAQPRFAVAVIEGLVERLRSATIRHVLVEAQDGEQKGAKEAGDRRQPH
jgi:CRP/FNR family transcriptional regulator, cyclic AMP receptor protein